MIPISHNLPSMDKPTVHEFKHSNADHRVDFLVQVTTLINKHDEALAQGPVSEQDVQHLKDQISQQNSAVKSANLAASTEDSQDLRDQVRQQFCSLTHSPFTHPSLTIHSSLTHHPLTIHSWFTHHSLTTHSPSTYHQSFVRSLTSNLSYPRVSYMRCLPPCLSIFVFVLMLAKEAVSSLALLLLILKFLLPCTSAVLHFDLLHFLHLKQEVFITSLVAMQP